MSETTKAIFERLDAIAAKLGIAAGHLWAILVKQAYVESVAQLAVGLLLAIAVAVLLKRGWKATADEDDFEIRAVMVAACTAGLIIALLFTVYGAMGIANPEYYAFKEITEMLK